MKKIQKLLSEQAEKILPDERVKENIRQELGYRDTEREFALANGGTAAHRGKKTLIAVVAAALAIALCLGILLPLLLHRNGTPGNLSGNKFLQIESTEDFYIYGAASVGSLLAASQADQASAATMSQRSDVSANAFSHAAGSSAAKTTSAKLVFGSGAASSQSAADNTETEKEIAETVNGYMALIENLLGNGSIDAQTTATPAENEYAGVYSYMTTITYHDLTGGNVHYILYYNKVLTGVEQEEDGKEESYAIDGVLSVGSEAYIVRGEHETEEESEPGETESESELTFTAYRQINGRDIPYIRMQQEISSEQEDSETETERKFVYTYYDEKGQTLQSTTAEYEEEDGELEVLLTVQKGNEKDTLLFRRRSGNDALRVTARIAGRQYSFTVQIMRGADGKGYYSYDFSDYHGNFDRFDEDDEDDRDD